MTRIDTVNLIEEASHPNATVTRISHIVDRIVRPKPSIKLHIDTALWIKTSQAREIQTIYTTKFPPQENVVSVIQCNGVYRPIGTFQFNATNQSSGLIILDNDRGETGGNNRTTTGGVKDPHSQRLGILN